MNAQQDDQTVEYVAKRIAKGCEIRHERIDRLEALASKTAQVVHGHGIRLNDMDERLTGLHQTHSATLIAVEACTQSNNRLSTAIDRLETWLVGWMADYEQHKSAFVEHKAANAAEKFALPRVALALWATTLTALGAVLAFFVAEWQTIGKFIARLPWQ